MVGLGVNATVISYMGHIDISFHCDADLIEDPWDLVAGLAPTLDELVDATD